MRKIRILSLALALLLVFSVSASAVEPQLPIYDEPTTVKIMTIKDSRSMNTYNEKQCCIDAEQATNIHVDWVEVPSDTWTEKINLTFASADLPDAIIGGRVNLVQNIDMTAVLNDYLTEEIAPNVMEIFGLHPELPGSLTLYDGKIHSLPYGNVGFRTNSEESQLWINTAWLDAVNKEMPSTTDELYDVLVAFRDEDPNGNGQQDEIPLLANETSTTYTVLTMLSYFGTFDNAKHLRVADDTVIFTPAEDSYFQGLQWLHKLYEDNLIWKDIYTADYNEYLAKGATEECTVGVVVDWYSDCVITGGYLDDFALLPMLRSSEEVEPLWERTYQSSTLDMFVVTTACKDVEAMVRWYDYINKDLTTQLTWFQSPEDVLWRYNEAGEWETFTDNVPADTTSTIMRRTVAIGPSVPVFFREDKQGLTVRYAAKAEAILAYEPYGPKQFITNGFSVAEEEEERNMLLVEIDNYLNQFRANAVVNGISEADWQKHLDTLSDIGVDDYVGLWQSFFDAHK